MRVDLLRMRGNFLDYLHIMTMNPYISSCMMRGHRDGTRERPSNVKDLMAGWIYGWIGGQMDGSCSYKPKVH
ncbi:hypothetical protein EYC84_002803 [Monilinia fructicola]|uniref:Uncharacterized protein n=1 Tax=Monilinia fructicola TaxID=38448 RepID=A0A5M9JR74_MONFR|nr:hypothetical protein EYC84_002803 [Monilinia fructicola]